VKYKVSTNSDNNFYRSGNPGYLVGYPVLIAENDSGNKLVDANGYKLFSSDKSGFCFTTLDNLPAIEFATAPLSFGRNQ
jgi:hypothetical protein